MLSDLQDYNKKLNIFLSQQYQNHKLNMNKIGRKESRKIKNISYLN